MKTRPSLSIPAHSNLIKETHHLKSMGGRHIPYSLYMTYLKD